MDTNVTCMSVCICMFSWSFMRVRVYMCVCVCVCFISLSICMCSHASCVFFSNKKKTPNPTKRDCRTLKRTPGSPSPSSGCSAWWGWWSCCLAGKGFGPCCGPSSNPSKWGENRTQHARIGGLGLHREKWLSLSFLSELYLLSLKFCFLRDFTRHFNFNHTFKVCKLNLKIIFSSEMHAAINALVLV